MLVEYAYGLAQTAAAPVATFLAPTVEVPTMIGRFKKYTRKHAFHVPNTQRAIGGRATEITFSAEDDTYNCSPHAIDVPVDELIQNEADQLGSIMQDASALAAEVAALQHETRVIDLAIASINSGSPTTTIYPCLTTNPDDAVDKIDYYIQEAAKAARYGSIMGIRVLFGSTALRLIKNSAPIKSRFIAAGKSGQNQTNPYPITDEAITNMLLGKPDVMTSWMVKDTATEGKADSVSFVLDSDIIVFAARQNPTRFDPSFMKTFRLAGHWMVPGTYVRDDQRVTVAKFDWTEDVKCTNSAAGFRIAVSAATTAP